MSTADNTTLDQALCEQVCAYMDGELPVDEARFLERRLANEPALRAKWERLQLASACMKGHPFQPMATQLPARVAEALAAPVLNSRQPWRLWAMAASIAALALIFTPRFMHTASDGHSSAMAVPMLASQRTGKPSPSPASADFVAIESAPGNATTTVAPQEATVASHHLAPTRGGAGAVQTLASASDAPTQFPLVESGASKSWPRAELPGAANDPSIEAYLVRHNQMLANDGLGGFVPYVDVVTYATMPSADSAADAGANSQ